MANYPIYYRDFQNTEKIESEDRKIKVFKNTVETLNNRILANSYYATWFRFKFKDFIIDTSSNDPNKQFMTSFRHELTGASQANKFTLNIAYDPFKYGQEPNASLSKIEEYFCADKNVFDEVVNSVKGSDRYNNSGNKELYGPLQCEFQYGYSEPINMVSPKYIGFVSEFAPNIIDGIITYTIGGVSGVALTGGGSHSEVEFPERESAKPLEVIKYELWRYFGKPDKKPKKEHSSEEISTPEGGTAECVNDSGMYYEIDIPDELIDHNIPTKVPGSGGKVSVMTYIKELLNISKDDRYKDEMSLDGEDNDRRPFYNLSVTDSDPMKLSVSLVVPCIKDDAQLNANGRVTGVKFNWMNQTNSIVTKWTPKVDGKLMILTANSRSGNKAYMNSENDVVEIANSPVQPVSVIPTLTNENIDTVSNPAIDAQLSEVMRRAQADGATATIGLLGLPCEIPLGAYLQVEAWYNQSKSYTSGVYMIKNSTTFINDSGLFSTDINLMKVLRYSPTTKNQEKTKEEDKSTEKEFESAIPHTGNVSNGDGSGGGFSGGGRSRSVGGRTEQEEDRKEIIKWELYQNN